MDVNHDSFHERDFQRSLEPDVIIDDGGVGDEGEEELSIINRTSHHRDPLQQPVECDSSTTTTYSNTNRHHNTTTKSAIMPDISIIPIQHLTGKKTHVDVRLFKREYSPQQLRNYSEEDDESVQKMISSSTNHTSGRSPRVQVRLISKDEAEKAEDTYARRKSLPLEKCPVCKKFFRRMKTHLLKHEQQLFNRSDSSNNSSSSSITEISGVPLTCNFCTKSFNTQSNLLIHMRTHTGDKPYVCDFCRKGFAQSCNLVNHMRIHTGERPFKCPYCDRAFTQSGNLNNHIRLHTDEKPFKCHFCDRAFVQSGNLNSHIRNNHKFMDEIGGGGAGQQQPLMALAVADSGGDFKMAPC